MNNGVHIAGGSAIAIVGFLFVVCAIVAITSGKELPIFSFLAQKSKGLWKDKVYIFYLVSGIVMLVLGILWATSVIWV